MDFVLFLNQNIKETQAQIQKKPKLYSHLQIRVLKFYLYCSKGKSLVQKQCYPMEFREILASTVEFLDFISP